MNNNCITVKQLNTYVKSLIENDVRLDGICVTGEISDFKNHYQSGHWYFSLKDKDALIRCVMFRSSALRVKFPVENGMKVILCGRVSLYEKDGQYQFYVQDIIRDGEGELSLAFKIVKQKLEAEGLFDQKNKRKLVKYPKRIAVVTSDTGAAVRDILNILGRRYPLCEVVMCPVAVQGATAAQEMIKTLDELYKLCDIDTVIIGRGGGSAEDLAAFNDEMLARKIYESPFPVISAVGHETDFSISDFVADVRASTPSAAAELATEDISEILYKLSGINHSLKTSLMRKYKLSKAEFNNLQSRLNVRCFEKNIDEKKQNIDFIYSQMRRNVFLKIENKKKDMQFLASRLDSLSPLKTLSRGYSAVENKGKVVRSVEELKKGDIITVNLFDGKADCAVQKTQRGVK